MIAWIEAHPGLAAWVQAIGTIGAVLFAIWVPFWQRTVSERCSARSVAQIVHAAHDVLSRAVNFRRRALAGKTDPTDVEREIIDDLETASRQMAQVDVGLLADSLAQKFSELRAVYDLAATCTFWLSAASKTVTFDAAAMRSLAVSYVLFLDYLGSMPKPFVWKPGKIVIKVEQDALEKEFGPFNQDK